MCNASFMGWQNELEATVGTGMTHWPAGLEAQPHASHTDALSAAIGAAKKFSVKDPQNRAFFAHRFFAGLLVAGPY